MNRSSVQLFAVSASSMILGAGVGYIVAVKHLQAEFDERLQKETKDMRTFYTNVGTKKYSTPVEAAAELVPTEAAAAMNIYQNSGTVVREVGDAIKIPYHKVVDPIPKVTVVEGEQPIQRNVFVEQNKRDPDKPYIISQEEFMQNDDGFQQATLTYYEKDDVLTDERDDIIDNREKTVGVDFTVSFGDASSDENTVHVRCERLRMDFEIVKSEGSYAKEVLDVEEEEPPMRPSARLRRERGD